MGSCCNKADNDIHAQDYAGKPQKREDEVIDPNVIKAAEEN